jgi:DNA-binding NarL/FixJ family response regulator
MDGSALVYRVLIVDDHPLIRSMVRLACHSMADLEVVGEAADGDHAVAQWRALRPDVVVLDLLLPRRDGLQVAAQMLAEGTSARILVLTAWDDNAALFEAHRLGVHGYLEKTASLEEIGAGIQAVARGETAFGESVQRKAHVQLADFARRARETAKALSTLTPREREVLGLVAEGKSTRQVATRLGLSVRTVETHISNLYQKLGVQTRVQAVYRAHDLGLVDLGSAGSAGPTGA